MASTSRREFLRLAAQSAGAAAVMAALPPAIREALATPAARVTGTINDVEHVVVLMQENRSFDHYFGALRGVRGFDDPRVIKLPGGAGFAPHQDAPAYVDFGVEHHVTLMVPIDAFTAENGALEMARNACAREFLPQKPDGTLRDGVIEGMDLETLLAQPGDVIAFDAWVPHRSGPNRSATPRRSFYLTYNPVSAGDRRAAYYSRKRECFPPEYEREPGIDYAARGRQFNLGNPFD